MENVISWNPTIKSLEEKEGIEGFSILWHTLIKLINNRYSHHIKTSQSGLLPNQFDWFLYDRNKAC